METFEKAAENLGALNEDQPAELTKEMLIGFFTDIIGREEVLSELRAETKEAFECFASSHGIGTKPLKEGYKFFKAMSKDRREAETVELLRDSIVDVLLK